MYEAQEDFIDERDEEEAFAAYISEIEYREKPCDVNCNICRIQDRATAMVLEQKGWILKHGWHVSQRQQFCPAH